MQPHTDPKLAAAQEALAQLVEDGAPDRVVAAGREVCRCTRLGLPLREVDIFTLREHARRRQQQDRFGR